MEMRPFGKLLDPRVAVERLLRATRPVRESERVPLAAALGRVPARVLRAASDVPPFARATWDGYAFAAVGTRGASRRAPAELRIVGEVFAEGGFEGRLRPGEAVAIATGGALPRGADTAIPFEEVEVEGDRLRVPRKVARAERIAEPGEDFARGTPLAEPGIPLSPATIGALGAGGATTAEVYRRPVVGIVPNGNELVLPGRPLGRHQIFESNNLVLTTLVLGSGAVPRAYAPVPDDARQIERALRRALRECDLVLATGGSSVGEHDYLPVIFPRLGKLLFHGLAVRPGKPTLAALADGKLLVGLPGHPTSCLANGFWMLLPMLRKLAHLPGAGTVPASVVLAEGYDIEPAPLATVVPLHVAEGRARPTFKDSSAITSLTAANAFEVLPPNHRPLRAGERRSVERLLPPIGN